MKRLLSVFAFLFFISYKTTAQGELIQAQKEVLKIESNDTGPLSADISGISVTNVADGFAKFIVKRGKAEAKLLFVEEFGNKFKTDSFFITLFPYTSNFIKTDLDLNNGTNNITGALRETVNKDLNSLYFNVPKLKYFTNSDLKEYYTIVSALLNKSKNKLTISNLVSDLDAALVNSAINTGAKKRIHLILSLYSSIIDTNTSRIATLQQIELLATDAELRKNYFQALQNRYSNDKLIEGKIKELTVTGDTLIHTLQILTEYNERIIAIYNNLVTSAEGVKLKVSLQDYQNSMIEFIEVIDEMFNNDSIKAISFSEVKILKRIRGIYDLYFDIKNKNYSSAILDLSFVLRQLYEEKLLNQQNIITSLNKGGRISQNASNKYLVEQKLELLRFLEAIGFYREFLSGLVNSKSSEEIEALVEKSALPIGSSILKKKNSFTFEIGSYLGASFNPNAPTSSSDAWQQKFGVTAPIGFNFSFGVGKQGKGGAISLFMPLIDVGAIAAYRFKDSTAFEFNLRPENILSPGFYFIYGVPKYPISIGYGVQYGPSLNKVINTSNVVVNNPTWRSNVVLSVDIPLWKLGQNRKKWIDSSFAFTLLVDEDWLDFPNNQDRNYTGGIGFDFRGRSVYEGIGKYLDVLKLVPINETLYPDYNRSSSLQLSTSIFTPKNLRADTAIHDDRPYSNLNVLTLRNNYDRTGSTLKTPRRLYYEVSAGVIGTFIGREFQTKIHEWVNDTIGSPIPMGWSNQISNGGRPTGMLKVGYEFSPWYTRAVEKCALFDYLEYKFNVNTSIGYYNQQQIGASLRAGLFRSNWYNFISDGNPNSLDFYKMDKDRTEDRVKCKPKFECYLFGDAKVYYMAYNSLLRGQTSYYNDSKVKLREDQVNNTVFEGNVGLCFGLKHFLITGKWSYRTPEVKVQNYIQHTWGSIYITYRRSF